MMTERQSRRVRDTVTLSPVSHSSSSVSSSSSFLITNHAKAESEGWTSLDHILSSLTDLPS